MMATTTRKNDGIYLVILFIAVGQIEKKSVNMILKTN